jgi:2',3'-cyclic-nucleotide 2'-phosphodiesterase (5'-nucleotidase family)
MPAPYVILHTNDFHNHLSSEQATVIKNRRDELGGRGLLLDAGDAISSGNITYKPGGEPILELMSRTGYAAMTVGNREFHFSRVGFHSKLSMARFPILCANVRSTSSTGHIDDKSDDGEQIVRDPPVYPWRLFELEDGFRIVVFGVTVPMITERMLVRKVSAYVFDDPIETAEQLTAQLVEEQAPDLLVALTHIGARYDRELAERVPGIDLIIGGHTHLIFPEGERVGETLIVQAGSHGRMLGTVEITPMAGLKPTLTAKVEPL